MLALPLVLGLPPLLRRRAIVFSPLGIAHDDPRGRAWGVRWDDLAGTTISTASTTRRSVSTCAWLARIDLDPGVDDFAERYPRMDPLRREISEPVSYALTVGTRTDVIPALQTGFATFAPRLYGGVVDLGVAGSRRSD